MTDTISSLSFSVSTNKPVPDMCLSVSVDRNVERRILLDMPLRQVCLDIDQSINQHTLIIKLSGKNNNHVRLEQGHIVEDVLICIKDVRFDGVCIDCLLPNLAYYTHDYNGTACTVTESFYGVMGCNGSVTLAFETPIYIWLLNNM